jgi:putative phosphoesterase
METCIRTLDPDNHKLGLISDTHDNLDRTQEAIRLFQDQGIQTVLHAGDVTNKQTLKAFSGMELYLALGNADNGHELHQACLNLSLHPPKDYFCITFENTNIFLMHGYSEQVPIFRQICSDRHYAMIVKGHTHFRENYQRGHLRVINPGALDNAEDYSVAILNTQTGEVDFHHIAP